MRHTCDFVEIHALRHMHDSRHTVTVTVTVTAAATVTVSQQSGAELHCWMKNTAMLSCQHANLGSVA
jgi:hypothetical protein